MVISQSVCIEVYQQADLLKIKVDQKKKKFNSFEMFFKAGIRIHHIFTKRIQMKKKIEMSIHFFFNNASECRYKTYAIRIKCKVYVSIIPLCPLIKYICLHHFVEINEEVVLMLRLTGLSPHISSKYYSIYS